MNPWILRGALRLAKKKVRDVVYSNATQQFDFFQELWDGDWYEDENRFLYILPPYDAHMDNYGPDNELMTRINGACRNLGRNINFEEATKEMGLRPVDRRLQRFNPKDGYYHA